MNLMIPGYLLVCFNYKLILINNISCDSFAIREGFIQDNLFKLLNNEIRTVNFRECNTDIYIILQKMN